MTTIIEPFLGMSHMYDTVQALLTVREADGTYPPPIDVDDGDVRGFTHWLMQEETIGRWVAIIDGKAVGHISITAPHSYLTDHLEAMGHKTDAANGYCEISKFFIAPEFQSHGVGAKIFDHALEYARSKEMQPALAVIEDSISARRFYAKKGLREVGSFAGIHGRNFIFADEL